MSWIYFWLIFISYLIYMPKNKTLTYTMTWGNDHKFVRKDKEYIMLLAYYKAFYFSDVKVNGVKVSRSF